MEQTRKEEIKKQWEFIKEALHEKIWMDQKVPFNDELRKSYNDGVKSAIKIMEDNIDDAILDFFFKIIESQEEASDERIKKYLIEFLGERIAKCDNIDQNAPKEWTSFNLIAQAVKHELQFLQNVIHAIEPYKP